VTEIEVGRSGVGDGKWTWGGAGAGDRAESTGDAVVSG